MLRWFAIACLPLLLSTTAARADPLDELLAGADLRGDEIYRNEAAESWGDWFGRIVPVPALADRDSPFGRSYALVIGVSEFEGRLDPLPATADNPAQMRELLIDQNFDLVVTLTNARATEQRIRYLMVDVFPKLITKDDRFLFYFSGHGVVQDGSGEGFLPLTASEGLYSNMFSMRDMRAWDGSLRQAKQVLFLLDTCFSGLAGVEPQADPRELSVEQLAGYAHHLVTASTEGEQTIASRNFSGSIFTSSLIEAARGKADRAIPWDTDGDGTKESFKDGVVSMYELISHVRTAVAIRAAEVGWGAKITPQLTPLRSSEGEFFFVTQERMQEVASTKPDGAEVQSQSGAGPGTGSSPSGRGFDTKAIELAFWQSTERGGTCDDYLDYLDRYPAGIYVSIASRRRRDLCPAPGSQEAGISTEPEPTNQRRAMTAEETEGQLPLSREDRRLVQLALEDLGEDVGRPDGLFGPRTRSALAAWQGSKDYPKTGYLDEEQAAFLIEHGQGLSEKLAAEDRSAGDVFQDCDDCPEMVVIPAGSFLMGSPNGEAGRNDTEGPQHRVTIAGPLAVGKYEVTFDEWDACVAAGGCRGYRPDDQGWGRGRRPVINVSWEDAQAYVGWLRGKTGQPYRLLSEAEWEYAARAGTETPFWTGSTISTAQANYDGNYTYGDGRKGEYRRKTTPVDEFEPSPWGLHDMHGNVREWVEDCWNTDYDGAPSAGAAWTTGDCSRRVLRGGSWNYFPRFLRSAYRNWNLTDNRNYVIGFRVARTLR